MFSSALVLFAACGSDPVALDAGVADDAEAEYDAGVPSRPDAMPRADALPRPDVGFSDPTTLRAGVEVMPIVSTVNPAIPSSLGVYFEIHGTVTSTMPPLFIAARGPGTNSEYLPGPMGFIVPGRLVVYYDIRGSGKTSYGDGTSNSTITVAQHVADLTGLIDYVGTLPGIDTSHVDLLGHGYGALLAMHFASEQPARVQKMALVNPFPIDILQNVSRQGEIESRIGSVDRDRLYQLTMRPECWGNDEECFILAWRILGRYHLCPTHRDLFAELTFTNGSFRNEFGYIPQDLRARSYDDRPLLTRVTAQTTVISGPCEPTPAQTALDYVTGIAGARHVILPDTGEFALVEAPAAFAQAVKHAFAR